MAFPKWEAEGREVDAQPIRSFEPAGEGVIEVDKDGRPVGARWACACCFGLAEQAAEARARVARLREVVAELGEDAIDAKRRVRDFEERAYKAERELEAAREAMRHLGAEAKALRAQVGEKVASALEELSSAAVEVAKMRSDAGARGLEAVKRAKAVVRRLLGEGAGDA